MLLLSFAANLQLGLDRVDVSRTLSIPAARRFRTCPVPSFRIPQRLQHQRLGTAIARLAGMQITTHPPVEAREWLTGNPNDSAFATNRFQTTERALAFVETLYAKGATEVLVDHPGVDASGEPYADTLLVRFPLTDVTRWRVQEFCEEEGPGHVPPGDFVMHVGQYEIMLWWD